MMFWLDLTRKEEHQPLPGFEPQTAGWEEWTQPLSLNLFIKFWASFFRSETFIFKKGEQLEKSSFIFIPEKKGFQATKSQSQKVFGLNYIGKVITHVGCHCCCRCCRPCPCCQCCQCYPCCQCCQCCRHSMFNSPSIKVAAVASRQLFSPLKCHVETNLLGKVGFE